MLRCLIHLPHNGRQYVSQKLYTTKYTVPGICMSFLVVGQWNPKTLQNITISLGNPSELNGDTLLPKTPHPSIMAHREIKLELTWRLHQCWLAFIVMEGTLHATKAERETPRGPGLASWRL